MRFSRFLLTLVTMALAENALQAQDAAQDAARIGDHAGKLRFTDIRYLPRTLDDFGKKKAYVIVFTSTTCPLVQRYLPTLQAMSKEYADKDVQFVAINVAEEDSIVAMATNCTSLSAYSLDIAW